MLDFSYPSPPKLQYVPKTEHGLTLSLCSFPGLAIAIVKVGQPNLRPGSKGLSKMVHVTYNRTKTQRTDFLKATVGLELHATGNMGMVYGA